MASQPINNLESSTALGRFFNAQNLAREVQLTTEIVDESDICLEGFQQLISDHLDFNQTSNSNNYPSSEAEPITEPNTSFNQEPELPQTDYLPEAVNPAQQLSQERHSQRRFSQEPLSETDLSQILSACQSLGPNHRSYPSASGLYPTEVFMACWNTQAYQNQALYYDPHYHCLTKVADIPSYSELANKVNFKAIKPTSGQPQAMMLFLTDDQQLRQRHGQRGAQFALVEVGCLLQQVSLQIASAEPQLKGVALGGLNQDYWLKTLKLADSQYKLVLGYLCGK